MVNWDLDSSLTRTSHRLKWQKTRARPNTIFPRSTQHYLNCLWQDTQTDTAHSARALGILYSTAASIECGVSDRGNKRGEEENCQRTPQNNEKHNLVNVIRNYFPEFILTSARIMLQFVLDATQLVL
jgi:hypothetical protein